MSLDIKNVGEFVGKVIEVSSGPTPTNVAGLLIAFINLFNEDNKGIEAKLDTLLAGPYKDGITFMENARVTHDSKRRLELIEDASKKFIEASNREEPIRAAQAKFYTGVCYTMLNDHELAAKSYREALSAARVIEANMTKKMDQIDRSKRVAHIVKFIPAPATIIGYTVGEKILERRWYKMYNERAMFREDFIESLLRLAR